MKIIMVANQKGGVGKSITAAALVSGLALKGFRTLTIDMDAQRNLTLTDGEDAAEKTVLGVFMGELTAREAIQHTGDMDIIAVNKALSGADAFIADTGKDYRLKKALGRLKGSMIISSSIRHRRWASSPSMR